MFNFNFNFIIPLKRDELLSSQAPNQYVVSEVYQKIELQQKLQGRVFVLRVFVY